MATEGWRGWDDYARFYDWENARTMGRQDVRFWQDFARREGAPVLELGCGTGRVLVPVARTGVPVVGIDRSDSMLEYAAAAREAAAGGRAARDGPRGHPVPAVRVRDVLGRDGALRNPAVADERGGPGGDAGESARVLRRGGTLGVDLVPDLPAWDEYRNQTEAAGAPGAIGRARHPRRVGAAGPPAQADDLRPGVRRAARRKTERHRFSLTFRTLPLPEMVSRVEKTGFRVTAVLGDYRGRAWDLRADVWLLLASRR